MYDVSRKFDTLREAKAEAVVKASSKAVALARAGKLAKGDVFEIARAAGVLAAKRTSELIPLCHNLPVDFVGVEFECGKTAIKIRTHVKAIWKTGVEMEALTAASIAALTVYDMLKPVDESLEIAGIRLLEKKGGKSQMKVEFPHVIKAAVVVSSDSGAANERADESGKLISERLAAYGIKTRSYKVLPDERAQLQKELERLCAAKYDLIMTTGGTGLGSRDVIVQATRAVIDQEVPGIAEASRSHGQRRVPYSMLSRAIAGTKGKTLIVNLPGSPKGVAESLDVLLPAIFHSFWMLQGAGH